MCYRSTFVCGLALIAASLEPSVVLAQSSGSRASPSVGSRGETDFGSVRFDKLSSEVAQSFITMEGTAELRLAPSEIRIVLGVIGEGESAPQCQQSVNAKIKSLLASWAKLGIARDSVVIDFIAVLPRYTWAIERRSSTDVGVEKQQGFQMQSNVHLAVKDEAAAQNAISAAFEVGITDIIALDYWSREIDEAKTKAREQALKAAHAKSTALLAPLFKPTPPVINLQEYTRVVYPVSLYHSFENSVSESASNYFSGRRDLPLISAARPKNTYYRGLFTDGDVTAKELPMKMEISVVSTVRLYYESPSAKNREKPKADSRPAP